MPQEVSNFAPPVIEKLFHKTRDEVTLAKASSQPQSTYEAASTLTEFELKKILLDKIEIHKDKDEDPSAGSDRGLKKRKISKDADLTTEPKKKDSTSGTSKGTKSQPRSSRKSVQSEELVFKVANSDMPHDQEGNLGDHEDKPRQETASRSDWFKKPPPTQEPTDPDWNVGKTNKEGPAFRLFKGTRSNYAELEYDFEECYKALSEKLDWENPKGGDYPFDLSKPLPLITRGKRQRAAQYDLPGIEDMVPNIWSLVKVAYDKYALWGISHWREQRKSFYAFARGMQSRGDMYSTKRILTVTHVSVIRKYGYGYLEEIVVRRSDNVLYRFKEGDDVADFAIALRMYTKSLVIQKRFEDLQLGVESYQKKINVTKPDTTRPDL
ncbi:hypothetical protein Tco_0080473 [Tanacetum coccineum]